MKFNCKISVFLSLVGIMLLSLGLVLSFNKQSSFVVNTETTLNANMTSLKLGQEVTVTLNLGNYSDVTNGYNAYKAKLIYDQNIFEQVLPEDFISLNDWEELEYNPDTFEFVAIKKVGSKTLENVVQVKLRVKTTAIAGTTTIKINNIVTSEGRKDIVVEDKSVIVNIIRDQVINPDNTDTGNSSNNNSDTIDSNNSSLGSSNKVDDSTTEEDNDDNADVTDKEDHEETFHPTDDNKEEKVEGHKANNIKRNFFLSFIIIMLIFLIIIIILYRRKKDDNKKHVNMFLMFALIGVCFLFFAGSVYAAYNLLKGELNEDGQINYDDLKLLELHLINRKMLPDYLLENADMNSDDKITVTDLTLLVQKLEKTLDYEVQITEIDQQNQYVPKNSNFTLSFKATVLYGAKIERVKINGVYYDVIKDSENDIYHVSLNTSNKAGSINYHFSEVKLNNEQTVDVDFTESIEVLKEKPSITNYVVKDSLNDSTLNIMFNLEDIDSSLTFGSVQITDETGNIVKEQDINKGSNSIMLSVVEDKVYTAKFNIGYNLTNDKDLVDSNFVGNIEQVKELQLIGDYQFEISNFVTEKDTYFATEKVKIYFESSNISKYVPNQIRINGQDYAVNIENGKYVVVLPEFKDFGKKTIQPEMIVLSNGKAFEIEEDIDLNINVIKRVPAVSELMLEENAENGEVTINFDVNDEDYALSKMFIEIKDEQGNLLEKIEFNSSELTGSKHITKVFKNLGIVSSYHVNVIASYSQTDNDSDSKEDVVLYQKDFIAAFNANIISVSSDKHYYEKGENVTLTYKVTTNGSHDISKIRINGQDYNAIKLEKDLYQVVYKASTDAIVEEIHTSKVICTSGNVASVSNKVQIEILKDVPKISDYKVSSNNKDAKVVLDFNIIDNDNSFIEGNVVLLRKDGSVVMNKSIKKGKNNVEFDVEFFTTYDVKVNVTYDRDSVSDSINKFTTTIYSSEISEIIAGEFSINNVNAIKNNESSKYFLKNEKIILEFDDANSYVSTIVAVTINNKQYDVQKDGNTYSVIVDGYLSSGAQTLTISKVKLANSHELEVTTNNQVQIEVLKDKPVIQNYKALINEDDLKANISFDFIDNDSALLNGNIVVVDKNNQTIVDNAIKSGENHVEISLEEGMKYTVKIHANYNLTSDSTITDPEVTGSVDFNDELDFNIDYDFKVSDFKTYDNNTESVKFHKDKEIKVIFESSNSTSHTPSKIRINGNDYDLRAENGKYVAVLSGFNQIGLNNITVQSITLSNGKRFEVNQSLEITILKDIPVISNLEVVEDITNNQVKVDFDIQDEDDTLTLITINLLNDKNEVVKQIELPYEAIHNISGISKVFDGVLTSKYKVEILGNYALSTTDVLESVVLASKEIEASARAEVEEVTSDKVYYEKESNVVITYSINTNRTENITSITINGKDYEATKLADGRYQVSYKNDNHSGVKTLEATKVTFDNALIATISNTVKVEVLKNKPVIQNYKALIDEDDLKANISFDFIDNDSALLNGNIVVVDKNNQTIVDNAIKSGENHVEISLEEGMKYTVKIHANYNLTSDSTITDPEVTGSVDFNDELDFNIDYDFKVSDFKTYDNNTESVKFHKDKEIKVIFESSNSTSHTPSKIRINGNDYDLRAENGKYVAVLSGFNQIGLNNITVQSITLSNGKRFEVNQSLEITILKDIPVISNLEVVEDITNNQVKVDFDIQDEDDTLTLITINLLNDKNEVVKQIELPYEAIHNISGISKVFDGVLTSKYKVEILGNYALSTTDVLESVVLASKEIEASARAEVEEVTSDKVYYEKESNVVITYSINTNRTENITSITINGKDYEATKLADGRYQVSYKNDNHSGVKTLEATKVTFDNSLTATISNTVKVEVLKDVLTVTNYEQIDNGQNSKVTLNFDVIDPDNSFISGQATLTKKSDNTVVTKNISKGSNSLEFDVVELEKYDFVVKATYDRDTNVLTESNDNKTEDYNLLTQEVQLVFDYNTTVSDITTSKNNTNTKYFDKGADIVVSFNSSNTVNYEVAEVTINNKTYTVTKADNRYQVIITGFDEVGVHTITIEKIKLSNTKEFDINSNNTAQIEVLKTIPVAKDFSYDEDNYGDVSVKFNVTDTDHAIVHGKVIISNGDSNIKEQDLITGSNVVKFTPKEQESYIVKVIASYDLDSNQLDNDSNYHENAVLLENEISFGKRQFQIKDIVSSTVYVQTAEGVKEASSINIADLNNLGNYIVQVKAKDMPVFYTTIEEYKIDNNVLKFVLKYDDVIQYNGTDKQNKLEIEYGNVKDGVVEGTSLELLIQKIEANPSGTFELTKDYDASMISDGQLSVISSKFTGTLNGNGYKISNLNKPFFNELEGATIKNLVFSDVNLSGANSKGTIANVATNTNITNVHIKGLKFVTGSDHSAGMIGDATNTNINQSSVTDFVITTSGHIRISAIIGRLTDGTIMNSYVKGSINSTQSKDGNGMGGILGHGFGNVRIENCISKIEITNNKGPRLNGAIVGIFDKSSSVLKNNVSLSTGTNFYTIHGKEPASTAINNYELADSGLSSNVSGNRVISVSKENINSDFYKNNANFDETIWDLSNTSFDQLPKLKNDDPNGVDAEVVDNGSVYIPDYNRIKNVSGYSSSKEVLYHNIFKLMPYYDAKYLVEDGSKFSDSDILNTKLIRYVMPYSNGKLLTYLTSENYNTITDIKVVFDDYKISNYKVSFTELNQNISIYNIEELGIAYAPNKYVIKNDSPIIETLKKRIEELDYATVLEPLTTAADARHYKDHYNEVIKTSALTIALQLLQNDDENVLTINNEVLNNKIREQLTDGGRFDKMIYAYNYYDRWYSFEIGGARVSDILLFENKMFKDTNRLDNFVNEVLVGNLGVNVTDSFFKSNIAKYTASSELKYFLDYIITNIGGYSDVNDWFTEYFGARNILSEFGVDKNPDILYRAWYQIKKNSRMILPIITLPADCTYIISGPVHLQIGPSQLYHKDVNTAAGRAAVQKIVNDHVTLVKRHLSTLAGSFDPGKWNNYCIMVYDCTKIITGYKNSYFPGTNIVIGTSPVYTQGKVGQNYPFFKNFSEVLGLWQPPGNSAGVGNTAGFLWFQARPGLTNYDTWTHEFEHALFDKIMLFQAGTRFKYGLETLTEGNVEQNGVWSENNLVQDVGPYYFNTTYDLNKEGNATQNLSPDRIDTREKLENYFKGQQNALDLLDYIEGKAFIRLTPEQQARVATRMNQSGSWSTWGAITAAQAEQMNLTSLESLYDNRIIIRPENAWGVSVRGLSVINSIGQNDYGFESVWVNRWYIGHNDNGIPDAFSAKRNYFEMLGYAGVDGYVTYGRGSTKTDLDAIQKITKSVTGTAMNWKEYKMSRYATVEENIRNNKYIDVDYMIERFYQALSSDTNRNASSRTNLRKIYYHYLKSVTNDFIDDPLGTTVEVNHIKTAEELVEKLNAEPYGYYVLDNDIDFSHMTTNVTTTFMGRLDGNGHKIIGNTLPIFNKIRYGYVGNIHFENTNIPKTISNAGALAYKAEMSTVEKIQVTNLKMNFGGRNDLSLIGGAVSNVVTRDCSVEKFAYHITSADDISKLNEDPSGIYIIDNDIDFTGKTYSEGSVVTGQFNGTINGNGHTLSNLTNASLFANFRGTAENFTIKNFSNINASSNFVAAFAKETFTSTVRNVKFENITLSGANNVAVLSGMDGRENANSVFENISVKNADVTGSGVYVSTFVGRKYGGKISNVFVQGSLHVTSTENGGLVGALQQNGTIVENVITDVSVDKPRNTYNNLANSVFNASTIGNIYNTPVVKNSIAFGNMTGYVATDGTKFIPYKFTGAIELQVLATLNNCYEVLEETGSSRVSDNTQGKLNSISKNNLNAQFYKNLGFDETLWNLDNISAKGYPILR